MLPGQGRSGSLAPAMNTPRTSLLITLTGRDRPGVTSRLFAILGGHPLSVLDVEQVVIRGRLVLGVLLGCDSPPDLTGIHAAVSALAGDLGLEAEITTGSAATGESGRPRRAAARHPAGQPAGAGRHHGHRRADRGQRGEHRPDRQARAAAGDVHRDGGLRRGPGHAPRRPGPCRGRAGDRRGGPARRAAPAGAAADRDGRGLHPHQGRGNRPAGRAGRLRRRGGEGDRGRHARRARLHRVAARAGVAARRARGRRPRRRPGRTAADRGGAHADRDAGRPRLQVGHRQRRFHPGDRAAGRRARHRLRGGQRAGDRRREAHRAPARPGDRPGRRRRRRCAGSPPTPRSRCPRRWRSATAPTIWT